MPYDNQFEITLFTIAFQAFGYLFMMLFANLFYFTGYVVDMRYNVNNDEKYRQRLFNLGYWFSFGLPFLIPLMIILMYFIEFSHLN